MRASSSHPSPDPGGQLLRQCPLERGRVRHPAFQRQAVDVAVGSGVDQLDSHPEAVARSLDVAIDHGGDPQRRNHAVERHRPVAIGPTPFLEIDLERVHAAELVDQFFRDAVGHASERRVALGLVEVQARRFAGARSASTAAEAPILASGQEPARASAIKRDSRRPAVTPRHESDRRVDAEASSAPARLSAVVEPVRRHLGQGRSGSPAAARAGRCDGPPWSPAPATACASRRPPGACARRTAARPRASRRGRSRASRCRSGHPAAGSPPPAPGSCTTGVPDRQAGLGQPLARRRLDRARDAEIGHEARARPRAGCSPA